MQNAIFNEVSYSAIVDLFLVEAKQGALSQSTMPSLAKVKVSEKTNRRMTNDRPIAFLGNWICCFGDIWRVAGSARLSALKRRFAAVRDSWSRCWTFLAKIGEFTKFVGAVDT